jgi:hypothetical protein
MIDIIEADDMWSVEEMDLCWTTTWGCAGQLCNVTYKE